VTNGFTNLRAGHAELADRAYDALRDLIVTRSLLPGEKVTAEGLAQRFGVSRTTVKTALDQLAAEGLVDVRPQVGTFIRGLTATDVRELWDLRAMIETFAAEQGVETATDAQRAELHRLVEAMHPMIEQREYRETSYEASVSHNRRLHELIVETANNAHLLGMYRRLSAHFHIIDFRSRRGLRRADLALVEHRAIADAYARRDADLVRATLRRHIGRSRDVILEALTVHDGPL
jgi:DNA-binding GntR family transcriptional regulator